MIHILGSTDFELWLFCKVKILGLQLFPFILYKSASVKLVILLVPVP